ncbi:MAG: hypothetical protein Q7P63_13405 [Verrucomicrobiota bacterium JB022]|nr:hypothetical protein [Verrucomicrobiota bacterium JB022]
MAANTNKLEWCLVRLGEDMNWWVMETSDPIHWDVDGLGILDPRQMAYILEQCEALREYGFDADVIEDAFFSFSIQNEEGEDGRVRLQRTRESLLEDDEATLFALPDIVDEEKGPYADFIDQITRHRVKMLNDLIDFDQNLTVDELEEEIRERQNQEYLEGRAVHPFSEITAILDYVPEGYELEDDEGGKRGEEEDIDDIPDFEDDEEEKIEEDETMRWDEDEDEDKDDFDDDDDEDDDDDDEDEDDDDDDDDFRR